MTLGAPTSRFFVLCTVALLSFPACEMGPASLGEDAPPLPAGTRTELVSLPGLSPTAFDVDAGGSIWLAGAEIDLETFDPEGWSPTWLGRVDADGELSWSHTFFEEQAYVVDIAVVDAGAAFLVRADPPRLEIRAEDGALLESEVVANIGPIEAVGSDLLLATGLPPQDEEPGYVVVRRRAASGETIWETQLDAIGPGDRMISGLEVDDLGVVWVAGLVRENVLGRWWVTRLDEDGVVLSELFSEPTYAPENGYKLSLHGDTAIIASSPVPNELHYIDAQGELMWSRQDEGALAAGHVVPTLQGTASLLTVHDQPEELACMTPWSPCPDALVIRHLSDDFEVNWSARQEDCAAGVQSRTHDGALLVLSACIENGSGARVLDVSRYAL